MSTSIQSNPAKPLLWGLLGVWLSTVQCNANMGLQPAPQKQAESPPVDVQELLEERPQMLLQVAKEAPDNPNKAKVVQRLEEAMASHGGQQARTNRP